ncbi:hypothetical protein CYG49_03270, partial [Candidatus Saccharibacteria bacterium]
MIAPELISNDEELRLIMPNVERDAQTSIGWLEGEEGRETLRSMGVTEGDISEPTLEGEEERIRELIESQHRIAWMIEHDGDIIGVVVVELNATKYLDAPAVSVMIGDSWERGKGIGTSALRLAIDWLHAEQEDLFIFARHRVSNEAAAQVLL